MHIIWKRPDGAVAITYPMIEGVNLQRHALDLRKTGIVPDDHELVAIDAPLPPRDEFRNAWIWDGKKVVHDLERAREIRRESLRREAIRPTPVMIPELESAQTLDDLRAVTPPE